MESNSTNIYSELSAKYKLHPNIIKMICNHPFIFASRVIADPDDERDIMFSFIGKIRIKDRYKGIKRQEYERRQEAAIIRRERYASLRVRSLPEDVWKTRQYEGECVHR